MDPFIVHLLQQLLLSRKQETRNASSTLMEWSKNLMAEVINQQLYLEIGIVLVDRHAERSDLLKSTQDVIYSVLTKHMSSSKLEFYIWSQHNRHILSQILVYF